MPLSADFQTPKGSPSRIGAVSEADVAEMLVIHRQNEKRQRREAYFRLSSAAILFPSAPQVELPQNEVIPAGVVEFENVWKIQADDGASRIYGISEFPKCLSRLDEFLYNKRLLFDSLRIDWLEAGEVVEEQPSLQSLGNGDVISITLGDDVTSNAEYTYRVWPRLCFLYARDVGSSRRVTLTYTLSS